MSMKFTVIMYIDHILCNHKHISDVELRMRFESAHKIVKILTLLVN